MVPLAGAYVFAVASVTLLTPRLLQAAASIRRSVTARSASNTETFRSVSGTRFTFVDLRMPNPSWKAEERRTCSALGMTRAPLSGRGGGSGTSGDCYDPTGKRSGFYVEIKHYAKAAIFTLFTDTKDKATREKRTPVVVMHKKGTRQRIAVMDFDYFRELLDKAEPIR